MSELNCFETSLATSIFFFVEDEMLFSYFSYVMLSSHSPAVGDRKEDGWLTPSTTPLALPEKIKC